LALSLELKDKKPYLPPREGFFVCVQSGIWYLEIGIIKQMKKVHFLFLGVIFSLVCFSMPAQLEAASLYLDPPFTDLYRGDAVKLAVRLDTDEITGECVNTVDAVISYSEGVEPVDIATGGSIFSIWVEPPTINKENRTITFAGGIPNGYCGRVSGDPRLTNTLAEIIFRSPGFSIGGASEATSATVSFTEQSTAYLNDGLGTKANLRTFPATFNLFKNVGTDLKNPWQQDVSNDVTPPQEFSISLQKDEKAFNQKYYIVFNTTDKETGIDQYQIMEEPLSQFGSFQWGRADAPWMVARSPYILKDQSLNSIIRVKAIDKAGNEYITNLIPDDSIRTFSSSQLTFIIILAIGFIILGIMFIIGVTLYRRFSHKKQLDTNEYDEDEKSVSDNFEEKT